MWCFYYQFISIHCSPCCFLQVCLSLKSFSIFYKTFYLDVLFQKGSKVPMRYFTSRLCLRCSTAPPVAPKLLSRPLNLNQNRLGLRALSVEGHHRYKTPVCVWENTDALSLGVGHLRKLISGGRKGQTSDKGKTRKDIRRSQVERGCRVTGDHYATVGAIVWIET